MRATPSLLLLAGFGLTGLAVFGWALGGWSLGGGEKTAGSQAGAVSLPAGDAETGRRAFLANGCALCHGGTGETDFPAPATAAAGPEIGSPQGNWSTNELARAILDPSHEVHPDFQEQRLNEDGTPASPMADYADVLSVQELADLTAYVHYLGE
jgi:mono/diheme cytochrome c family protein